MSPVAFSSSTTTAAVLHGKNDIRVEERKVWPPQQGQVQVAVVSTGLCGSDHHYYAHGKNGDFEVRAPLVLGHEAAGVVTAVGGSVYDFKVGQRVAIEAGIACRTCSFCDKGRYNLCRGMRFCSSAARFPHVDGTLQTRMNHPAHVLHPLPDSCSFELASLAEPLSVLIHASRRVQLQPKQTVLVFGVGAIGLLACALSKHTGASRVVAVDINPQRLEFAKKHGFADDIFCLPSPSSSSSQSSSSQQPQANDACCSIPSSRSSAPSSASSPPSPDDALKRAQHTASQILASFAAPDGFDAVFECTGSEPAIQSSIYAAATGGRVILIGMGTRAAYMPLSAAALREVDVLGSFRYAGTYPEAIKLLSEPRKDGDELSFGERVSKLVTHRFKLADTARAFELMSRGLDDKGGLVLKVMVGSGAAC